MVEPLILAPAAQSSTCLVVSEAVSKCDKLLHSASAMVSALKS